MSKKLSYEFVKEQFEKEGYQLLSKEYINSNQKLYYICNKGHKNITIWEYFQQNKNCSECSNRRKKTIEEIRELFEREGYKLLTNIYKDNKQKLDFICPNNHQHKISFHDWLKGSRCGICKKRFLTIEDIKKEINIDGYILLSNTYINSTTKLLVKCPKNHIFEVYRPDWVSGGRCPECSGHKKLDIDIVRKRFEIEGYTLLSTEYINAQQKLNYICPEGHRHSMSINNFTNGYRCRSCFYNSKTKYKNINIVDYWIYRIIVERLMNRIYKKYKWFINPNNLKRGFYEYHIDHIFSVLDGFANNILPEVVANPFNLRMLSMNDNLSKNGRSDITINELYEDYNFFLEITK
jgi:hypothetical protein